MRPFLIIILSIFLTIVACGRRGILEKPENEGPYPRQYPAPENNVSEEQFTPKSNTSIEK